MEDGVWRRNSKRGTWYDSCSVDRMARKELRPPSPVETVQWTPSLAGRTGPIYRELAAAIAAGIRDGRLMPGDRLPTQRLLAQKLGVDLATVTRGYAEAHRQGLVSATVGRGTFVRVDAPLLRQISRGHPVIDMSMNLPPLPADPSLQVMLQEGLARLLRRQDIAALMTYHWDTGSGEDRDAGAAWLAPSMGRVDPQRVLLCPGAQSGLVAVVTSLARTGDVIATEQMAYPGLRALAGQFGITLAGVEMDRDGMMPDSLDRVCHQARPRLIVCTPTIQNPTTATMPLARRLAILEIARAHGIPILEDDAYGLFPFHPPPALASLAPDQVFHLATLAKTLTPGLRLAYLVAPSIAQVDRLTAALRGTSQMGSALTAALVTGWIRDGAAARLFEAIREEATARQDMAQQLLGNLEAARHPNGLHLWLRLPAHWQAQDFAGYARRHGLALVAEDSFAVDARHGGSESVRIALGAAEDRATLAQALVAIEAVLRRPVPEAYTGVV